MAQLKPRKRTRIWLVFLALCSLFLTFLFPLFGWNTNPAHSSGTDSPHLETWISRNPCPERIPPGGRSNHNKAEWYVAEKPTTKANTVTQDFLAQGFEFPDWKPGDPIDKTRPDGRYPA